MECKWLHVATIPDTLRNFIRFRAMGINLGSPGSGGMGQTGRTVYVGNLPSDASVDELLNLVRFGPIDSVKVIPEKSCAFISFLDPVTAAAFHSDALMRKLKLHENELKIGWGKPSAVPANVVMAVQQSGASRNVYLGHLDEKMTEQALRDDLSRFGPIDQVKIVRDKNIGFVHFLSIATAIKVVQSLAQEPSWAGKRVNYGKDRCAYVPKNQHQQQQHNMAAAAMAASATGLYSPGALTGALTSGFNSPTMGNFATGLNSPSLASIIDPSQAGNRTVYLGNIHPETTTEEICNTIRGGILQQIRYIPDKHICFITFVE
jgi:RNA recognition motif-containing protein